ncbi:MAG TPA: dienelactone hydrolase family protein [Sandaracinaceae bacterium LLY-WYZ-13_1]|nr:dienelactone hydrolase family protein [Sandaracinaceae bacterium LLY-WYZ-13_1]
MISKLSLRIPLAALALALLTSFARPTQPSPMQVSTESPMRVSRHFAAGLEYLRVEPPDVAPDAELPMVVYLHGRGDRPPVLQGPLFDVDTPVRVILPRGPERFGDGYAWAPVSAHDGESEALVHALSDRSRMLAEAMHEWRRRHPTRGRPIVVGFSQGGMLAMTLSVHHPAAIARAFPVAGWLPPSLEPARFDPYAPHAPVVALHGADDAVLSATRTQRTLDRLSRLGYPVRFEAFDGAGHETDAAMRVRLRALLERSLRELPPSREAVGSS